MSEMNAMQAFFGPYYVWASAVAGFVFGAVNFWLLVQVGRGMVDLTTGDKEKDGKLPRPKLWKTIGFFAMKMVIFLVTIGLILRKSYVSSLPFLAGFTASLILGISLKLLKNKPSQDEV